MIIFDHSHIILLKRSTESIGKLFYQVPAIENFKQFKAHREIAKSMKEFVQLIQLTKNKTKMELNNHSL